MTAAEAPAGDPEAEEEAAGEIIMIRKNIAGFGLLFMALAAFGGFYVYYKLSGDAEGITVGKITGTMLLVLSAVSFIKINPWK